MALQLAVTYKGFDANYWRINEVTLDTRSNLAMIYVGLYKDQATRNTGLSNTLKVEKHQRSFASVDWTKDIRSEAYRLLKESSLDGNGDETNKFNSAVDILE